MKVTTYKKLNELEKELINVARKARENAYAPYSNYKVGSSVLSFSGKIYFGCNIESADYTLTTHAEICAINNMVLNGEKKIKKIAVITQNKEPQAPCGLCRQKMIEFADEDVEILDSNFDGSIVKIFTLLELLPNAFTPKRLEDGKNLLNTKK